MTSVILTALTSIFAVYGRGKDSINHIPNLSAPFLHGQALFVACKMKVFDLLKDEAPLSSVDIARKIDASEHGTERLLDVCAALGLLEKTERGEGAWRCFAESLSRWKQVAEKGGP